MTGFTSEYLPDLSRRKTVSFMEMTFQQHGLIESESKLAVEEKIEPPKIPLLRFDPCDASAALRHCELPRNGRFFFHGLLFDQPQLLSDEELDFLIQIAILLLHQKPLDILASLADALLAEGIPGAALLEYA